MPAFTLRKRLQSLRHAIAGLGVLIRSQHNARIHLVVSVVVIGMATVFELSPLEWSAVIFAVALVWMAEALNTGIELVCDVVSPEFHPKVKQAKDVAAAGVLVAVLGAVCVGLIIFLPRFVVLLH